MNLNKKPKAFTLVELLVVAAIVSFCLSAILTTFTTTVALNEMSRNLTTATTHAEYILENIKNTAFASISSNTTNGVWNWNTSTINGTLSNALNSEAIVTSQSGSNPLTVTVTVSWNDLYGRSRTLALQTLFSG